MTAPATVQPDTARSHRGLLVVAAVVAWFSAYRFNAAFWRWLLGDVARVDLHARVGDALRFFVYDTTKIALLLVGIIYVVTVARSFISLERTRALLGGRREGVGNVAAAGLGVITPFCSCSAVPAFLGFVAAGVPVGITLSFLIASPLVNEVAVVLLYGLFGWRIAAAYIGAGLLVAIVAGWVLGRLGVERWVEPFVFETNLRGRPIVPGEQLTWAERSELGREEVATILRKIWPYLLVGIALGAVIHGWVPASFFTRIAGHWYSVPAAVILGVPLYSNAAGIMPLVEALHAKGIEMGTLLAFMMAVVALSAPEMILLRRVLRPQLLACFIGVLAFSIVGVGYAFNLVL